MTADRTVTTVAGFEDQCGAVDARGAAARFRAPRGLAIDSTVRRVEGGGTVSTFIGVAREPGETNGDAATARLTSSHDIAIDSSGTLYVATPSGVRKVTPAGMVSTFVSAVVGLDVATDGTVYLVTAGYALSTPFSVTLFMTVVRLTRDGALTAIGGATTGSSRNVEQTVDQDGNVYFADALNVIRKLAPNGDVTVVAGVEGQSGVHAGPALAALGRVRGLAWYDGAIFASVSSVVVKTSDTP